MLRVVILADVLQVTLSLVGLILSLNQLYMAWLGKIDALRAYQEPSITLVANIRLRRERARTWKHTIFLTTGIAITWWRIVAYRVEVITWVSITRDVSILIVSFILIRETILAISDRREVGAMMDAEHKKRTNGDTLIVAKTNGTTIVNGTDVAKETSDGPKS